MKLFKCDMCGKVFDGEKESHKIIHAKFLFGTTGNLFKNYDLCTKCVTELERIIKFNFEENKPCDQN